MDWFSFLLVLVVGFVGGALAGRLHTLSVIQPWVDSAYAAGYEAGYEYRKEHGGILPSAQVRKGANRSSGDRIADSTSQMTNRSET